MSLLLLSNTWTFGIIQDINSQFTRSDTRLNIQWAASWDITDNRLNLPQEFVWVYHNGPTFIMHIVKLVQTWLIETEGNMGVMICLSQGGLRSLSALSSLYNTIQAISWILIQRE